MSEQETHSVNVGPGDMQPGKPDPSSKPSIDKLIDINHHLMRRVEELEEAVKYYIDREARSTMEKIKNRGATNE